MGRILILKVKLAVIALTVFLIGYHFLKFAGNSERWLFLRIIAGTFGFTSTFVALFTSWMASLRISYGHNITSAYKHVLMMALLVLTRHGAVRRFTESWKNARKSQEDFLRCIIKANRQTDYARDFGLGSVTSLKELRQIHPLTTYERYRPYVDRMAKGEEGVLTGEPVERFALTSGTTGKSKMLPFGKTFRKMHSQLVKLNIDLRLKNFGVGFLQREMTIYTAPKVRYTDAGIRMGPASMKTNSNQYLLVIYTTPAEGFQIRDPQDAVYVHLLFGFRDRNLHSIGCNFTTNLMAALRMAEQRWPDIVRDIEKGTVTTSNVPPEIHQVLVKEMAGGNPKRAAELKREFEKGFVGIMKRVWPHLKFVQAIDGTGLKEELMNSYARGVQIFGYVFAATEAVLGVDIWPRQPGKDEYVLLPSISVMEFIPEAHIHEDQPETLFIDELQVGGVYEVVVTQMFGIYRFRFGDVIRVKRYHFETPVVEFMYRSGQILNVHGEKIDQTTVHSAVGAAVSSWANVKLTQYAVAESSLLEKLRCCSVKPGMDIRPYYIVFLELNPTPNDDCMDEISLNKVDEELCRQSFTYNSYREKKCIAPPVVHIVKPGTFDRLHDFIINNSSTSANQYKVPRKLRTVETLQLMLENSVYKSLNDE